jgi:glycosyltransferase involved in cell wall biosynthesis
MTEAIVSAAEAIPTRSRPLRVCVAIPTYRRPELLRRLLGGVAALAIPTACVVEVLVMDNDPAQSAGPAIADLRERFPFALSYAHVKEPGLSSVRNFALSWVRERFDFLAMIDDDELPQSQWLLELMRVQERTQADGVVGPVPRLLPPNASHWLRTGKFFDLPVYADGSSVKDGYSGNCLLRVSSIERLGVRFDLALNFAGGEDLMFFREMLGRGAKLAYAAHAVAEESMSAERLTATYILQLNFRRGNTLSLCDRRLDGRARAFALRALKACARIGRGCATLVPGMLLRGRTGAVRALSDVAHGLGGFAGLFGHTYQAYDRPDRAAR